MFTAWFDEVHELLFGGRAWFNNENVDKVSISA
jgi:hypothetical protein